MPKSKKPKSTHSPIPLVLPKIRTKQAAPTVPNKDGKNLIVNCFFAKHPEKVGAALGFTKHSKAIKQVASMMPFKALLLLEGRFGYFWLTSTQGFFFEICRDNLDAAISSLEEPFKLFTAVCANKTLFVHHHTGTRYPSTEVDAKMRALQEKLQKEGYRISILV